MAFMAILDGSGRKCGKRCGGGVWCPATGSIVSSSLDHLSVP